MEEERRKLNELLSAYRSIREGKLATGITIHTMSGDFAINKTQIVNDVLDFLIREANEHIRAILNEQ